MNESEAHKLTPGTIVIWDNDPENWGTVTHVHEDKFYVIWNYLHSRNIFRFNDARRLQWISTKFETIIITRHTGLVEWLANHGITGNVIAQATPDDVRGKIVVGMLPYHLAALAVKVRVVDLPGLTLEQRGKDLTPDEMDAAGATLATYRVIRDR